MDQFLSTKAKLFTFYVSVSCLFFLIFQSTDISAKELGTIQRTTKQQILATIQPNSDLQDSQPILTSPSGNYAMYFRSRGTSLGAGGSGSDFCHVQVQDASTGLSVWESECTPVSNENTCSLVFSDQGLEVFDGSRSAWDTGVDASVPIKILELVDDGDMRISDQNGVLLWRATDDPRANQECGSPGSAGMASELPPYAAPIDGRRTHPFGQTAFGGNQQQQQPFGYQQQQQDQPKTGFGQPLGDNTPFDSGNTILAASLYFHLISAILLSLAA